MRRYRKLVLAPGEHRHAGGILRTDRSLLEALVRSWERRAFDTVPIMERATFEPEAACGRVVGLSVTGRGLLAIVDLNEKGSALVGRNPGLAPRLVKDMHRGDGLRFPIALQKLTLTPEDATESLWEPMGTLGPAGATKGLTKALASVRRDLANLRGEREMISLSNDDDRFAALQRRDSELDELIAEVREGTGDGRRLSMETLHRLADEFEGKTPRRLISDENGVRFARPA